MTNDIVLKVENINKVFKVYSNPLGRIKEWVTFGRGVYHKPFQALDNISFEVRKGHFLGIIGPNGAGKSTLLKIITGVLEPTSGTYQTSGTVLSLLELSGGMDPDLSGRENIIRTAQLLGFPPIYIQEKMVEIANFAELGDFFDEPLAVYSSGMRIRLAFSMFAFLECDILILDEVLAVGDIFFRQKCYARLAELIKQNVAILLVTHSTGTVREYCDDVIVMQNGAILYHGSSDTAIQKYFEIKKDQGVKIKASDTYVEEDYVSNQDVYFEKISGELVWPAPSAFAVGTLPSKNENDLARLSHLLICDEQGNPKRVFKQGETVCFYYAYEIKVNMGVPISGINLLTVKNILIHGKNSLQDHAESPLSLNAGDIVRYKKTIKLDLAPGEYIFDLALSALSPLDFSQLHFLSITEFNEKQAPVILINSAGVIQVISAKKDGAIQPHVGICNLDGSLYTQVVRPA